MIPIIRPWWQSWSVVLAGLVLMTAVTLQGTRPFQEVSQGRPPHLAQKIPANLTGWSGRDLPLGATEFISAETEKVLNCDDVLNREFIRGHQRFGLYIAYWSPGKMPTRMVASHTPDRCWTENGWHCLEMRFKQTAVFGGFALQPAEWRVFEPPLGEEKTYVVFWHLVDGKAYGYGKRFNNIPDPVLWWKDAVQQALQGSREQYFIRLTSSEPLENFAGDPGFQEILHCLEKIGLSAPSVAPAKN